jgi:hypothetical protein
MMSKDASMFMFGSHNGGITFNENADELAGEGTVLGDLLPLGSDEW